MTMESRIRQDAEGWWFKDQSAEWVGPYDDEDEAQGSMSSSDADDAQAKWERENL